MMKKIILSLACATILTSSFAMNTPIQKINSVQQQSTTINQQAQAKSALWQLIKANPVLSLYLSALITGQIAFIVDLLLPLINQTNQTNQIQTPTTVPFNEQINNALKNVCKDASVPDTNKIINTPNTHDNFFSFRNLYTLFCPGYSSIAAIYSDGPKELVLLLIQTIIAIFIVIVALSFDLAISLTFHRNNSDTKNKNLLIAVKNVIKNLLNKIFTQSSNVTATTDLIKKLNTITK